MNAREIDEVQKIIGYAFNNSALLIQALTNKSYTNEQGGEHNERLEFLGDGLLNFLVAEFLYANNGSDEGRLTSERAATVSRTPLAAAVDGLGLIKYYRLGKGAVKDLDKVNEKFKSNLFEAVLGAIYLDGGIESAREFVKSRLLDKKYRAEFDYKSELQKAADLIGEIIKYNDVQQGEEHISTVTICGKSFSGKGRRIIDAQQAAAQNALNGLYLEKRL